MSRNGIPMIVIDGLENDSLNKLEKLLLMLSMFSSWTFSYLLKEVNFFTENITIDFFLYFGVSLAIFSEGLSTSVSNVN